MSEKPTIRIAFFDSTAQMGGGEHLLLGLLEGLTQDQYTPVMVCAEEGPLTIATRSLGIETYIKTLPKQLPSSLVIKGRKILNPVAVIWNGMSVLFAAWQIAAILRKQRVKLIQTNSAYAHICGGLAGHLAGIPCIWYYHELVQTTRMCGGIAALWRVLARLLAAHVIGVSQAVIDALDARSFGTVIYAGRPHPEEAPASDLRTELGIPPKSPLIAYLGRIAHAKGLDILVDAARQVVQSKPEAHFVILGDALFGEHKLKRRLQQSVLEARIEENWHWLGYRQNATAYLRQFTMVVLPSRREAISLVLMEASMHGIPVVASRVGGTPEVVQDGVTGLLVPPADPTALAQAIKFLLENPAKAQRMGEAAISGSWEKFDMARYHAAFNAFYDKMLR